MLKRLLVITIISLSLAAPTTGVASEQGLRESIVQQLVDQGYYDISYRRTLLGRIRIIAENDEMYREIVINPSTNVILRDYWRRKKDEDSSTLIHNPGATGGTGGGSDDDDSSDDDDDDDDDDVDDDDDDDDDVDDDDEADDPDDDPDDT